MSSPNGANANDEVDVNAAYMLYGVKDHQMTKPVNEDEVEKNEVNDDEIDGEEEDNTDETDPANVVAAELGAFLGQKFIGHESMYLGDYWRLEFNNITIKVNSQPQPYRIDEYLEEDFKDYRVIIYVEGGNVPGIIGLVTSYGIIEALKNF